MRNDRSSLTRLDQVDPLPLLRELMRRGEADPATLTLLRLQWLRREQPAARVETAVVPIDDRLVAVHARIEAPDGWSVSAHAAVELPENPTAAMEQAELRALARALDLAGYAFTEVPVETQEPAAEEVTPETPREAPPPEPIVRPVNRPAVVDALRKMPSRTEAAPQPAPEAAPASRPQRGDFTVVHDRRPTPPQSAPGASGEESSEDETPLEDYSWTAFWRWAKAQGLNNQAEIAEVIGQPVGRMNPGEIRAALRERGVDG